MNERMWSRILVLTGLGAGIGLWAGCSASSATTPGNGSDTAGSAGSSGGAAGAGMPSTGGAAGGVSGGDTTGTGMFNLGDQGPMGAGGAGLPDGACGAVELKAEKVTETHTEIMTETRTMVEPAALYIMQDQSGSMIDKWGFSVQAILDFINDPRSDGLDVAIQYFPLYIPPCIPLPAACDGSDFATPEVPFGRLGPQGMQNQAISDDLGAHAPCGAGTPIEAALRGAIQGCLAFEQNNPGEECYALLITDGEPSGCAGDAPTLTGIAADGLSQGIPTYTVGMPGADFTLLDSIAQAGGTDCNGDADPGLTCDASSGAQFLDALSKIRETVTDVVETEVEVPVEVTVPLDCNWTMPTSQTSDEVDPSKVNVNFTDQGTGAVTELGKVGSEADCASVANGWYYDDPEMPTELIACPNVCDLIKAADAKIDVLVGCDTKIAVPE